MPLLLLATLAAAADALSLPTLKAATVLKPGSGTPTPALEGLGKKSLVVLLPQLGEFDSCEFCEQLAAVADDLARADVGLRVIGIGEPAAGERFAAFAASTKVTAELHDQAQKRVVAATNGTLAEAIEAVVDGTGGWGAEEVFLQSFVLNRMRDELAAARPPKFAPSAEVHWTTRGQFVGARDVVAYRLGRNASLVLAPYMMKRWRPDPLKNRTADDRFLECLGARDAAARTSPSELALVDDRALQRNTLACVDALAVDLGGAEPSHPLAPQQAARSLFPGAENPYPDLVALRDKVRRWVDG
mmetsp:Transcript_9289/g.27805  ORF Transcript_9289/g.27805 Transcript_9289/m.27805 type:complete len:302 (+) Transcript_9289:214-1119(+)